MDMLTWHHHLTLIVNGLLLISLNKIKRWIAISFPALLFNLPILVIFVSDEIVKSDVDIQIANVFIMIVLQSLATISR